MLAQLVAFAAWFAPLEPIMQTVLVPGVLGLGYMAVAALNKQGVKLTYGNALVRAAGVGMAAAQRAGLPPFGEAGMLVAAKAGADYMVATVGSEAAELGIPADAHGVRVAAQIDTVRLDALAVAAAASPAVAQIAAADPADLAALGNGMVPASMTPGMRRFAQDIQVEKAESATGPVPRTIQTP